MNNEQFNNSEQPQYDSIFLSQPPKKNAAYFRKKAREVLKPCLGIAILAFLVASLLGGVTEGGFSFSFSSETSESEMKITLPDEEMKQLLQNRDWGGLIDALPPMAIVLFVIGAFSLVVTALISVFISSPVKLGYQRFNLDMMDTQKPSVNVLFAYFKKAYFKSIKLSLLYGFLIFLICLPAMIVMLFVFLPAILQMIFTLPQEPTTQDLEKAASIILLPSLITFLVGVATIVAETLFRYTYRYCFMILAEYPETGVIDALRSSRNLMRGRKWKLFCLEFSFIGWMFVAAFAGVLTCGIGSTVGMLILMPYMHAATTAFYDDAANREAAREAVFPSLNPDDYDPDANEEDQI